MPQKRNPDVFELLRGRTATAQAALNEALGIFAKLPSGYQRDLQLLKAPLFRGIDLASQTLELLPHAIAAMAFKPQSIKLDPAIHAAEQAYAMVMRGRHPVPRSLSAHCGQAQSVRSTHVGNTRTIRPQGMAAPGIERVRAAGRGRLRPTRPLVYAGSQRAGGDAPGRERRSARRR